MQACVLNWTQALERRPALRLYAPLMWIHDGCHDINRFLHHNSIRPADARAINLVLIGELLRSTNPVEGATSCPACARRGAEEVEETAEHVAWDCTAYDCIRPRFGMPLAEILQRRDRRIFRIHRTEWSDLPWRAMRDCIKFWGALVAERNNYM